MARTTLVLGFLFFVPKSIALQVSNVADDAPNTFVSANKLWCGQAPANIANDALRLYKSMPRSKLFAGASVSDEGSCEKLGYNLSFGEDPCYPGLQNFFRNDAEKGKYGEELTATVEEYGELSLDVEEAHLLEDCQCKEGSTVRNNRGSSCNQMTALLSLVENNPVRTFVSKNKRWCAEARENVAKEALHLYKSMPRAMLYDGSKVRVDKSCKKLGYKWSQGEDPCFPELKTYSRNEAASKEFVDDLEDAMKKFGEIHNFTVNDTKLIDSCQCKDNSFAKKYYGSSCDKAIDKAIELMKSMEK